MNDANRFGIDIGGFHLKPEGPAAFQAVVFVTAFAAFLWSIVWILRDSEQRGKSGCLALIFLIAVGWPLSILWWLWLRPPMLKFKLSPRKTPPKLP